VLRRIIKDSKDFNIVIIYTREPHARQLEFKEIAQPTTWEERCAIAKKTKEELKLDALILIDDMGDPSRKLFGDVPNPAIFIEMDGTIKDKLVWADGDSVLQFLKSWKPLPKPPASPDSKLPPPAPSKSPTSDAPQPPAKDPSTDPAKQPSKEAPAGHSKDA
jgi:hypothetical protein